MIQRFQAGKPLSARRLNQILAILETAAALRGDGPIQVAHGSAGGTVRLDVMQLWRFLPTVEA